MHDAGRTARRTTRRAKKPAAQPSSLELVGRIGRLAREKLAEDLVILDLRQLSPACDFFVLASGGSEPQVRAITDHIEETLAGDGVRPWHVEGRANRKWVLIDYVDVVVHVFHRDARDYYRLESLWADAPRISPDDESGTEREPGTAGGAKTEAAGKTRPGAGDEGEQGEEE